MAECVFKWVKTGDLMIAVNTAGNISDELWARFMEDFGADGHRAYLGGSLGILEVSSAQRKSAAKAMRERGFAVSILTDDVLVRGIVTAVSWLGANAKSYPWSQLDLALGRLDVGVAKTEVVRILDELRVEVEAEHEARRRERAEVRAQKRRSS